MDREASHPISWTDTISATPQPLLDGPRSQESRRIIDALRAAGFVAYLAGGCVRDALLGRPPKDYDVATDATPQAVRNVFGKAGTLAYGASFGVIGVLPPRGSATAMSREPTEVATFRSDGTYSDGRRPDSVHYGDARQDALRRDFTINGMFYDTVRHRVIDYVDGQRDLAARLLRTIGDPLDRFGEDKLRMLRAVRFSTTLQFAIESDTLSAIRRHADDIGAVSGERIGGEMRRILTDPQAADGLARLIQCELEHAIVPELAEANLERFRQLIAAAVQPIDFPLALACLLVTLPDRLAMASLTNLSDRWRLSNEESRRTAAALTHWPTVAAAHQQPWSVVQPVLTHRDVETIVALATAIVTVDRADPSGIAAAHRGRSSDQLDPPPLIDGHDLTQLGIPPGPRYRRILQTVRDAQLNGQISTPGEAEALARLLARHAD